MLPQQRDQKIRDPAAFKHKDFLNASQMLLSLRPVKKGVEEKLADESPYAAFSKTNVSPVCECSILQW